MSETTTQIRVGLPDILLQDLDGLVKRRNAAGALTSRSAVVRQWIADGLAVAARNDEDDVPFRRAETR